MGGDSPDYPSSILGQADGSFLLSYMGTLAEQYDSTGKVIREYTLCSGDTNIRNDVAAIGSTLITLNQEQNGFVLYDLETGKEKNQIAASKTQWKLLRAGSENDFYYMDEKGLHHVSVDGKLTETIIDASDMPSLLENKSAYSFEMGKRQQQLCAIQGRLRQLFNKILSLRFRSKRPDQPLHSQSQYASSVLVRVIR